MSSSNVHLKVEVACVLEWETDYTTIHDLIVTKDAIFATSFLEGRIFAFDRSGKALTPIGQLGQGPSELLHPMAMTCDGPHLYVGDSGKQKVYKIDLVTGKFLNSWTTGTINNIIVNKDLVYLAFNGPNPLGVTNSAVVASVKLGETLQPEHFFFQNPCCISMPGTKYSGILLDSDGFFWVSFTGEYRLEKYSHTGQLIKVINTEPPGFAAPGPLKASSFNAKARTTHFRSFDKTRGLFELDDLIVLYRFKLMSDARLDVYDHQGAAIGLNVNISGIVPTSTFDGVLYGYRKADSEDRGDIEIMKISVTR